MLNSISFPVAADEIVIYSSGIKIGIKQLISTDYKQIFQSKKLNDLSCRLFFIYELKLYLKFII